jgi:hypothetical protein
VRLHINSSSFLPSSRDWRGCLSHRLLVPNYNAPASASPLASSPQALLHRVTVHLFDVKEVIVWTPKQVGMLAEEASLHGIITDPIRESVLLIRPSMMCKPQINTCVVKLQDVNNWLCLYLKLDCSVET